METVNIAAGQLTIAVFVGLLIWAAYADAVNFIIPNRLCLAITLLYPAHLLSAPAPVDWLGAIAAGAGVFLLGYLLFRSRFIGGGDAKLLAATALWAGPELLVLHLVVTALAGGVISLMEAVDLRLSRARTPDGELIPLRAMMVVHVPYGMAIAIGGLFVAARLLPA